MRRINWRVCGRLYFCSLFVNVRIIWFTDADGSEADVMASSLNGSREPFEARVLSSPFNPEYLSWKERVIANAQKKLQTGKPHLS